MDTSFNKSFVSQTLTTEGNTPDIKIQLREWHEHRNYNLEIGFPNKEELERLGLVDYH